MPLDADTQGVLDLLSSLGMRDFSELSVEEARNLSMAPPPAVPSPVAEVENRSLSLEGRSIAIRIYRPDNPNGGGLVYYHGGGWVIGDLDSHDETCRILCAQSGTTIVSVDYRLAPECPFPGPFDDCYDATCWVAANAETLGIDPARLAVGGDSAGGNLAAAVALKARDTKQLALSAALLVYPVTDCDFNTPSYTDNAEGYFLTRSAMQWFWDHYAPTSAQRHDPYAAPLRADRLGDLPATLVQTAQYDPLRDEGEAYAKRLEADGTPVTLTRYDGVVHGFFGMQATVATARTAMVEAAEFLKTIN